MTTPNEGGAPTPASIREELGTWVRANWDPERPLVAWRTLLADAGWAMPSWPTRWHGRGWPAWSDQVVASELAALGAVGNPLGAGVTLAGPTILTHGPDHLRERFLRPILTGEETWCQLFSEPGAGSDLAGLTTSAVLDGDEWIINGQKVWNTSAHHADLGILVARTDSSVPKHRGITFFVISMHQPGVTVRPLRQMNFHASFNEVFFDDARIPKDWVVGTIGGGWSVALTTLAFERGMGGLGRPRFPKTGGRTVTEAAAEAEAHFETYKWYPQRAGRPDLAVPFAREHERNDDPLVRQRLASLHAVQRVSAWTADRAKAARALGRRREQRVRSASSR